MKEIRYVALGALQANCYLLINDNNIVIIDPGTPSKEIENYISDNNFQVVGIILTHAHHDHVGGVDEFAQLYKCPVYLNFNDIDYVNNSNIDMRKVVLSSKINDLKPGKFLLENFDFEIIDAPGHSKGCSLIKWDNNLFTGDVLFKDSIGRTDLYGGSNSEMKNTIKMIKQLDYSLVIYPGHGQMTTLEYEIKNNIYFK